MKKISVIVPTFQPQSYYLEKCLISLSNQTMKKKEYEILLILNGNKDPYEEMIKGIVDAIPDNNINVLYSMLTGVSNARNTGLDVAKGEYIAFVDDDDYVSSSYLERLYTSASPDVISLCYPLSFMDGVKTYMPYYITDSFIGGKRHYPYLKARRYFSVAVNKLIHNSIIGERRFDPALNCGEDCLFMFDISDKFKYISFTSQKAVYYRRIREGSATFKRKSIREILVNRLQLIFSYIRIYFKHPGRYNLSFFITRILGAFHGAIGQLRISRVVAKV